ncbi:MAG TPA: FtsQ-type POTRA domain-containing protein, partial [Candidatus Hydrogenedentes bacterium]|nr:FtsQ-type POTRA domain-containing protein [Candidatus Hydrogenedentota bacterium]
MRCGELVLFLGVVVGGGYALYDYARTSERLRVETITVDGALVLDEMDVITESGVTNADNLLFLDVNGVRDRVLAMPYVKSCRVERDFPNKVIVSIEERTAF